MTTYAPFSPATGRAERKNDAALKVMLLYESIQGASRAAQFIASLAQREAAGLAIKLSPLSFSTLGDPALTVLAAGALRHAHVLVIAMSSNTRFLPVPVENWLKHCLARRRGTNLAVAALFANEERLDREDSPRLRSVKHLVEEAGGSFFAPVPEREDGRSLGPAPSLGAHGLAAE